MAEAKKHPVAILCDFDGTIAVNDVGNTLFRTFADAGWRDAIRAWKAGEISSRECLARECAASRFTPEQFAAFAAGQVIDDAFPVVVSRARQYGIPIAILSDGLENYISIILGKYGLSDVPVYSNRITIRGNRPEPEFPYHEYGCGRCGNCKCHHLNKYRAYAEKILYIGDGFSDRCAAGKADAVFAKGDLAAYCRDRGIGYQKLENFTGILDYLEKIYIFT